MTTEAAAARLVEQRAILFLLRTAARTATGLDADEAARLSEEVEAVYAAAEVAADQPEIVEVPAAPAAPAGPPAVQGNKMGPGTNAATKDPAEDLGTAEALAKANKVPDASKVPDKAPTPAPATPAAKPPAPAPAPEPAPAAPPVKPAA